MRPSGTDLDRWADRLDCRARLPELVRRLIHATAPGVVEAVDFPAGEGIQKPGVDGRVQNRSPHVFVPQGPSIWELGTSADVKAKADEDYKKRTGAVLLGVNPSRTTYVFVTPRRWTGRDEWAAARAAEKFWADVRAYDADSLEQWLELAPSAATWLAEVLGMPTGARTLEDHWTEWSAATVPPTVEAVVRAGRDAAEAACLRWLREPPRLVSVATEEPAEAAAFLYTVLRSLPPGQRHVFLDRGLVVTDDATLRRVGMEGKQLIIAAVDCKIEVARLASQEGHHVLHASRAQVPGDRIELSRADRSTLAAALEPMGLAEDIAARLANESSGSIPALRRMLGAGAEGLPAELAPLLLVDGWNETNEADLGVVARVLGRSVADVRELTRRYSREPDGPLRCIGEIWRWRSRLDAWRRLARGLVHGELARFADVAVEVLTIPDPAIELGSAERLLASLRGPVVPCSEELRTGLAEGIAYLATESSSLRAGLDEQGAADPISRGIFAGLDTWQKWATLDRLLSVLAEASPSAFLRRVELLLDREDSTVRELAQRRSSGWTSETLVVPLVRALETLAWSPEHFGVAADLLARLSEYEVAATQRSAALESLREIFLPWLPHTMADVEMRRAWLGKARRRHPEVGFSLFLLLLAESDHSTGIAEPRFRPWLVGRRAEPPDLEQQAMWNAIGGEVVAAGEADPRRWPAIVANLGHLSRDVHRPRVLADLRRLDASSLSEGQRVDLRQVLRQELRRHRRFTDADDAVAEAELSALEALYARLEPPDPRERHEWLFDAAAEIPGVGADDLRARREAADRARATAATELIATLRPEELIQFARGVKDASLLGSALAAAAPTDDLAVAIVRGLVGIDERWARDLRAGVVHELFRTHGYDCLERLRANELGPVDRAEVALGLPSRADTFSVVNAWGPEAVAHYWRNTGPAWLPDPEKDLARVLVELVNVGRVRQALSVAARWGTGSDRSADLDPELVVRVLTAAEEDGAENDGPPVADYDVGELLKLVRRAGREWHRDLVRLEWAWLPVLKHAGYHPGALFDELANDPDLFAELVTRIFRGDDDRDREVTPEQIDRASHAFHVLNAWRRLPGAREDGTVDADHLRRWVDRARQKLRSTGHGVVGDQKIGSVIAHSPPGSDGCWPHEAVRDLFEEMKDRSEVELGFWIGKQNQRGVHGKEIGEGGASERAIADTFRMHATVLQARWPRIASALRSLASSYDRQAGRADILAADEEALLWSASVEDRLVVYVDEMQRSGRYNFSLTEVVSNLGRTETAVRQAVAALMQRSRLVCPEQGFLVIVPLEYETVGSPPPSWYLDDWMRWANEPYYVGLLSAAALHGAAHQEPQVFQVLVSRERPQVTVGRVRIEFVSSDLEGAATRRVKTDTGEMTISTPETTTFDLVRHADRAGGIDSVAEVLSELGEELDRDELAKESARYEQSVVERALRLLEGEGFAAVTAPVRERMGDEHSPSSVDEDVEVHR